LTIFNLDNEHETFKLQQRKFNKQQSNVTLIVLFIFKHNVILVAMQLYLICDQFTYLVLKTKFDVNDGIHKHHILGKIGKRWRDNRNS
jgi:hypothetical protein